MPLLDGQGQLLLLVTVLGPTGAIDVAWRGMAVRQLRQSLDAITTTLEQVA